MTKKKNQSYIHKKTYWKKLDSHLVNLTNLQSKITLLKENKKNKKSQDLIAQHQRIKLKKKYWKKIQSNCVNLTNPRPEITSEEEKRKKNKSQGLIA
jgi:hypothetical protein